MINISKVLVPIDFSSHGLDLLTFDQPNIAALKYGYEFASRFEAQLHVLHVVYNVSELEVCTHEDEKLAQKKLNDLVIQPSNSKIVIIREIRKGRPFIEIIKYSKEQSIDLIVMGTHGRKPLSHLLIGSEAENTVRKASCPVLVVRHPEHEFVLP